MRANGVELHLLEWGDPTAQPVLMVHGMRGHARWFTPVGPAVAARYRALSLDLRGHGESGHAPPYGPSSYAQDVVALVDALALQRPILVGHSMGGRVTTLAAGLLGDRVAGLVVVDSGLGPPATDRDRARPSGVQRPGQREAHQQPTEHRVFDDWDTARARFELRPGATIASPEMLDHLAFHALEALEGGRFRWRFAPELRRVGPRSGPPNPIEFPELNCPVASIYGGQSLIRARTDLRTSTERFVGATWTAVEVIEHVHHHVFVDDAQAFNPILMKYLARMASDSPPCPRRAAHASDPGALADSR